MSILQSHRSHSFLRTVVLVLLGFGALGIASFIEFRTDRDAPPTGTAVDPQQIMREKKDLPAQPLADFSVIFPEGSAPPSSSR